MSQIRLDRAHIGRYTTNGVLTKYKASKGYRETLRYYADKIQQGWEFESNWFPHQRARALDLDSLDRIVYDLSKTREVYVREVAFASDGSTMENGRVIFTRDKVIEIAEK